MSNDEYLNGIADLFLTYRTDPGVTRNVSMTATCEACGVAIGACGKRCEPCGIAWKRNYMHDYKRRARQQRRNIAA